MITFISKLIGLAPLLLSSLIGLIQVLIKLAKELITAIVNFAFPFTPDSGDFEKFILKMRNGIDKFDAIFGKLRDWLIKTTGITL